MKNRIYFFTGTGNSLKAAKDICENLPECELVPIKKGTDCNIPQGYERVGFVFPVYCWGLPAMVADFLQAAAFPQQGSTYFFAVATMGGLPGVAIPQTRDILHEKGMRLNYGRCIRMFANSVSNYNMSRNIEKITRESGKRIQAVIPDIAAMKQNNVAPTNKMIFRLYAGSIAKIHEFGSGFNVNDECVSCQICLSVCPAGNITMQNGKPAFDKHCEGCTACIQHCPKKAINYMAKTQKRRRYTHPQIGHREISQYY